MQRVLTVPGLVGFAAGLLLVAAQGCVTRPSHTCEDGRRNGQESDVDCGGPDCGPCGLDGGCAQNSDCQSALCARRVCVGGGCRDGVRDGDETDVDCGGSCVACGPGGKCTAARDCGSGVCTQGVCAAASCADQLRNGTETDRDCGGGACPGCAVDAGCRRGGDCASGACLDGACVERCRAPLALCGAACVDSRFDPMNCGGCGIACPPSLRCNQGMCGLTCPSGTTACGPDCVDTMNDVLNCGDCTMPCVVGDRCVSGMCQPACGPGQASCQNECVTLASDPFHCGMCGRQCAPGAPCVMGQCRAACITPLLTCDGGSCIDPRFDPDNCNGCGIVCPAVQNATRLCLGGSCARSECNAGFGDCNFNPGDGCETNLRTSSMHCGACGFFCMQGQCDGGVCQ